MKTLHDLSKRARPAAREVDELSSSPDLVADCAQVPHPARTVHPAREVSSLRATGGHSVSRRARAASVCQAGLGLGRDVAVALQRDGSAFSPRSRRLRRRPASRHAGWRRCAQGPSCAQGQDHARADGQIRSSAGAAPLVCWCRI